MKNENDALNRLTDYRSKVSSHYLIKRNGEVVTLVQDLYIAWHAGKSTWRNLNSLNKNSIGIEISNPGHEFKYKKYSYKQIRSLLILCKFLMKKYKIKSQNVLGHSDIAPDRKKDPGEKFPWKYLAKYNLGLWHSLSTKNIKKYRNKKTDNDSINKFCKYLFKIGYLNKYKKKNKLSVFVIKAFQRRYRQELIDGKLDKECLLISENIAKKFD